MNTTANTADTTVTGRFEELDYRESDGIQVSLLWSRATNALSVVVIDTKTDEQLEFSVEPARARDAFRHPFAYAPSDAVETASRATVGEPRA